MLSFNPPSFSHRVLTTGLSALGLWLGGVGVSQAQTVTPAGATLYANNCAMCHGASPATGASRIQLGLSAAVLQNAITSFAVMRGPNLTALTATDLTAVAAFIAADVANGGTTTPVAPITPTTAIDRGQALFAMCVACHGATPATGYDGIRKATTSPKIMQAITKVRVMRTLSVDAAQAADIAAYVVASVSGAVTIPGGSTGASYASTAQTTPTNQSATAGTAPQHPALTVAGGCTLGRADQPTDPLWLLMLAGAVGVLGLRRSAKA
jgi:mono/diheme cytochrome c family protein